MSTITDGQKCPVPLCWLHRDFGRSWGMMGESKPRTRADCEGFLKVPLTFRSSLVSIGELLDIIKLES